MIHIYPIHSWISIEVPVAPMNGTCFGDSSLFCFLVTCPKGHCGKKNNNEALTVGCRFFIFDATSKMLTPGTWYQEGNNLMYYPNATNYNDGPCMELTAPTMSSVIKIEGQITHGKAVQRVSNIVLKNLKFADTDYTATGWQSGFNIKPGVNHGIPEDAALRISGAANISVTRSTFAQLGGGGVHASNDTIGLNISRNICYKVGQTCFMFSGNNTSQCKGVEVGHNQMQWTGDILASASGIFASTVHKAHFHHNEIRDCSRWGIAMRSAELNSVSTENLIEYNIIKRVGLKTRDLGGLSFLGPYQHAPQPTNNTVQYNCVQDVIGIDTNHKLEFLTPFFNWAIYLDNYASGFTVHGNIAHTNVQGGVFNHGGSYNVITNNIFFNSSETYTYTHTPIKRWGAIDWDTMSVRIRNSTVRNNIAVSLRKQGDTKMTHISWKRGSNHPSVGTSDFNVFWNPYQNLKTSQDAFAGRNFSTWQKLGYDHHSVIADPMFYGPQPHEPYNFLLKPTSPALKQGFKQLPSEIATRCSGE
eukprot:TRINITY_DN67750_c0_g2_i1.p1 TRINITY_DN67750_c0_g2~~TRINITY_DN67750_c0_g2_i1.p1  ORF type:complete len:530 (+),score=45.65 TRINITY_DN67750_c0_g2_i1:373-1962(+)